MGFEQTTAMHYYRKIQDDRELIYYVPRLWDLAADLPVVDRPLENFNFDKNIWFNRKTPTLHRILDHLKKIQAADLAYPIILSQTGKIMDGYHRLAKSALEDREYIKAVQFVTDPQPDETREINAPLTSYVSPNVLAELSAMAGSEQSGANP